MADRRVLALDIGGTKLASAVVDAEGRTELLRVIPTRAEQGAEHVLGRAIDLARRVLDEDRRSGGTVAAFGVATNGLTHEDRVALAPSVAGWESLKIPSRLREAFPGMLVTTLNDVKAATLAESVWGALREVDVGLYINLGTGIAAGITANGQIFDGAHGAAGEIAYLVPTLEVLARQKAGHAPLEEVIGGRGVAAWASAELGSAITMAELMSVAPRQRRAFALRERLLDTVGLWVANVAIVVDPRRVVLGGGLVRSPEPVLQRVRHILAAAGPCPIEVALAHFGADSALLGAGAAAHGAASRPFDRRERVGEEVRLTSSLPSKGRPAPSVPAGTDR